MQITLCFKDYQAKMSLDAMRRYKAATGKDLWHSLLLYLETYLAFKDKVANGEDVSTIELCRGMYDVLHFDDAAQLFHAMIIGEMNRIPLAEIEDAMFRSGWMPSEAEHEKFEPWPLIMYKLALDVDGAFREARESEKKEQADT